MTSNALDRIANRPVAAPTRVGQATAVEQSRAVAEVQAAIVVAQQCPRNLVTAIAQMEESCKQKALAERAFYRFPRAGGAVSGASVHLARELARCFGNIQYGIAELRRDDELGQSEVQAYAWDVQNNTRATTVFVVPHKRDTTNGVKALTDMRDIYENNANNGSRRLREMIFSVLPAWFVEQAKELCTRTLSADTSGKPLPQRCAEAVAMFAGIGVTEDQLAQKLDRPSGQWTEHDLAQLGVIFRSLQRGEISKDEEFAPRRVTADEIRNTNGAPGSQPAPDAAPATEKPTANGNGAPAGPSRDEVIAGVGRDRKLSDKQLGVVNAIAPKIGLSTRELLHEYLTDALGRKVGSVNDLTSREASTVIGLMQDIEKREQQGGAS